MSIHLQYTLQQEHLLADGLTIERINRRVKNYLIWGVCALLLGVGLWIPDGTSRGLYLSLALTTLVMNVSLAYGLQPWLLRKQVARLQLDHHPFDLILDDTGLTVTRQAQTQQLPWAEVKAWYQGRQSTLIELPMRDVLIIPYAVLSEQRAAFDALLTAKLGQAKR